jgi:hypothetical protein
VWFFVPVEIAFWIIIVGVAAVCFAVDVFRNEF